MRVSTVLDVDDGPPALDFYARAVGIDAGFVDPRSSRSGSVSRAGRPASARGLAALE